MAFKACRSLTFILLLCLSVVTVTVTVGVSPVSAVTGGSTSTYGDPDSPKDTGPKQGQSMSVPCSLTATLGDAPISRPWNGRRVVSWMMVQQLLSTLLGRPGLLR